MILAAAAVSLLLSRSLFLPFAVLSDVKMVIVSDSCDGNGDEMLLAVIKKLKINCLVNSINL